MILFFFSSRRRHTRYIGDWSSDVCSSDLGRTASAPGLPYATRIGAGVELVARLRAGLSRAFADPDLGHVRDALLIDGLEVRSEERRVGKEGRCWWWRDYFENNKITRVSVG